MKDGGRVIPNAVVDDLTAVVMGPSGPEIFHFMRPAEPLTRRQKLRLHWMDLRWRVVTAAEVLAGRHECD